MIWIMLNPSYKDWPLTYLTMMMIDFDDDEEEEDFDYDLGTDLWWNYGLANNTLELEWASLSHINIRSSKYSHLDRNNKYITINVIDMYMPLVPNGIVEMMKIPLQHLQHLWHDHHEVYPSANFGNRWDLKRRKEVWALLVSGTLFFSIFSCLIIVCLFHLAFVLAGIPGWHVLYLKHSFWDLVSSW